MGQVDSLAGPFFDSALDTNRQHFTKVYLGVSWRRSAPGPREYNVTTEVFGGPGATLFGSEVTITLPAITTTAEAVEAGATIYNERGRAIGATSAVGANNSIAAANYTLNSRHRVADSSAHTDHVPQHQHFVAGSVSGRHFVGLLEHVGHDSVAVRDGSMGCQARLSRWD